MFVDKIELRRARVEQSHRRGGAGHSLSDVSKNHRKSTLVQREAGTLLPSSDEAMSSLCAGFCDRDDPASRYTVLSFDDACRHNLSGNINSTSNVDAATVI